MYVISINSKQAPTALLLSELDAVPYLCKHISMVVIRCRFGQAQKSVPEPVFAQQNTLHTQQQRNLTGSVAHNAQHTSVTAAAEFNDGADCKVLTVTVSRPLKPAASTASL